MEESWSPLKVLEWTTQKFAGAHLPNPRLEAQLLLSHALGLTRVQLYTQFDKPLGSEELKAARELIKRRLAGEPVAYIIGQKEFWSMQLAVDPRVLIPRPDTETLIETALELFPDRSAEWRFIDVGTGAGPIALSLAKEYRQAKITAVDISSDALSVATHNIERLGFSERIRILQGNLLTDLAPSESFDMIAANLPYIDEGQISSLASEVRKEPMLALSPGPDGLILITMLCKQAPAFLTPQGYIVLEHGFDQAAKVAALLKSLGYRDVDSRQDSGGIMRITVGRKPQAASES